MNDKLFWILWGLICFMVVFFIVDVPLNNTGNSILIGHFSNSTDPYITCFVRGC